MDPRPLRALSRELVRELGMLSQQCGSLALSPWRPTCSSSWRTVPPPTSSLPSAFASTSPTPAALARLAERELIAWQPHPSDGRSKEASLTEPGKAQRGAAPADGRDHGGALAQLSPPSASRSGRACGSHRSALSAPAASRGSSSAPSPRPTIPGSPPWCAVSAEYGLTADKGYGVADPNLDFSTRPIGSAAATG